MNQPAHFAYVEPIRRTIQVHATVERAFSVFTSGMSTWWLGSHTVNPSKAAIERIVMEPRVGGRWYEVGVDGSECEWGQVLVWEPPHRLVLGWQIDENFLSNPNFQTQVEVQFFANSPVVTDVMLEHRELEKYGETAAKLKGALSGGWQRLLGEFAAAVADPKAR